MRRILAIVSAIVCGVSLMGCGGDSTGSATAPPEAVQEVPPAETQSNETAQ